MRNNEELPDYEWARLFLSKKLKCKTDWHDIVAYTVNLKNDADYMRKNLRKLT